jgi:hypothetical protein
MRRITYAVDLTVQGPIITKSTEAGKLGVDAPMARRAFPHPQTGDREDRFYLPGSLVKGVLRDAWGELGVDTDFHEVKAMLGAESSERNEPKTASLFFTDFVDWGHETKAPQTKVRISIEEETGAAEGQMLQMMDAPYMPGEAVRFAGEVEAVLGAGDGRDAESLGKRIRQGLLWAMAAGAVRTSGFGAILECEVKAGKEAGRARAAADPGTGLTLRMEFGQPLIIAHRRVSENYFESSGIVPGGAIKAAVAYLAEKDRSTYKELLDELHAIRFTHAFPAEREKPRPAEPPLSLVSFPNPEKPGKAEFRDWIGQSKAPVVRGEAGKFKIDWKDEHVQTVRGAFGFPKLETTLRVRTAIDREKRKADKGKLFAWQMTETAGLEWAAHCDASGCSAQAREQLASLLELGLRPIGKSKAAASVRHAAWEPGQIAEPLPEYIITLQTPALLMAPSRHLQPDAAQPGATDGGALRREYEDVWRELSGGALRVGEFYQQCSLAGGHYLFQRFSPRQSGPDYRRYKPYLLTDAGSCFVVRPEAGREADALAVVNQWLRRGLPLTEQVKQFYGVAGVEESNLWRSCPYLPENGYGEITATGQQVFPLEDS